MRGDEPMIKQKIRQVGRVPHLRGDEPSLHESMNKAVSCSPHAWG